MTNHIHPYRKWNLLLNVERRETMPKVEWYQPRMNNEYSGEVSLTALNA
jgi:hypothetical protein